MIAQTYPLFLKWDGLNWRVIGWKGDDADLNWQPVVVPHGRTAVTARSVPTGSEYTLLVALNGSPGADNANGDNVFEWQLKWRRQSWTANHQCGNHYQTLKGITNALGDLQRKTDGPDPIDRLSILRRRVGAWERQPLTDYTHSPVPPDFTEPDPRPAPPTPPPRTGPSPAALATARTWWDLHGNSWVDVTNLTGRVATKTTLHRHTKELQAHGLAAHQTVGRHLIHRLTRNPHELTA
jgi:hypothetical protein